MPLILKGEKTCFPAALHWPRSDCFSTDVRRLSGVWKSDHNPQRLLADVVEQAG